MNRDEATKHELTSKSNLSESQLKPETDTYVIIDGYLSNHTLPMSQTTKNSTFDQNKLLNY